MLGWRCLLYLRSWRKEVFHQWMLGWRWFIIPPVMEKRSIRWFVYLFLSDKKRLYSRKESNQLTPSIASPHCEQCSSKLTPHQSPHCGLLAPHSLGLLLLVPRPPPPVIRSLYEWHYILFLLLLSDDFPWKVLWVTPLIFVSWTHFNVVAHHHPMSASMSCASHSLL